MKFEIPFDASIARKQYELKIKLAFRKNLSQAKRNLIYAVLFCLLAWLLISGKSKEAGYFFLFAGLYYFVNTLHYFWFYRKRVAELTGMMAKKLVHLPE